VKEETNVLGKIMALDVGAKTIGVAFCEEGTRLAFPGETLWRTEGKKRDMAALRQLVADNDVRKIVVGMPLLLDGTRGIQAEKVEAFIASLRNHVRIPIDTQDEALSTSEAADLLLANNKRHAEHKKTIDSVAAALILEWYLEERVAHE
jgi:putative Holliday junction resolvase